MEAKSILSFKILRVDSKRRAKCFFIKSRSFKKKIKNKFEALQEVENIYLSDNADLNNLAQLIEEICELPIPDLPTYLNDIEGGNDEIIKNELEPVHVDLLIKSMADKLLEDIITSSISKKIEEYPAFLADSQGGLFGNFYELDDYNKFIISKNIFSTQQAFEYIHKTNFYLPDKERLKYDVEKIFEDIFSMKLIPN